MSGGVELMANVVLPYSRIVIIGFAAAVVAADRLLLTRTRLGLFVRGVTQNRPMASALGVPTGRVDTMRSASDPASPASPVRAIANRQRRARPRTELHRRLVHGRRAGWRRQLAGTVYAALGPGIVNKFLEAWSGAVLAKIAVLVFIIVFIQKRPQGLFALKGRMADA
jgi:urea transport system permease protein